MDRNAQFFEHLSGALSKDSGTMDQAQADDPVREAELDALLATFLPDHTASERSQLAEIQRELDTQDIRLNRLHETGVVDTPQFTRAMNLELSWAVRRCTRILGKDRCQAFFGIDSVHNIQFLDERSDADLAAAATLIAPPETLIERYVPARRERKHISQSLRTINPQDWRTIVQAKWGPDERYKQLVAAIGTAEEAYQSGNLMGSITHAEQVLKPIAELLSISDTPLYLAAWAYHVRGRAYEALSEPNIATAQYHASLSLKLYMSGWLSPLPTIATELKLATVELTHSPPEAAIRFLRVADALERMSKLSRENRRFYQNLMEDSQLGLAESFFQIGNAELAREHAQLAVGLAKKLRDSVGEIRAYFVLFSCSPQHPRQPLKSIARILRQDVDAINHPRVSAIVAELGSLLEDTSLGRGRLSSRRHREE